MPREIWHDLHNEHAAGKEIPEVQKLRPDTSAAEPQGEIREIGALAERADVPQPFAISHSQRR